VPQKKKVAVNGLRATIVLIEEGDFEYNPVDLDDCQHVSPDISLSDLEVFLAVHTSDAFLTRYMHTLWRAFSLIMQS
jgi:hypothetical protein